MKTNLLRLAALAALTVSLALPARAQTMIEVSRSQYVLPVSELATTKTYPDLLRIAGDAIEAQVLPNRGRLLSALAVLGGPSLLYQSFTPQPMVLPSGLHAVEFGGYYLSIPWNTRDRQPYDLAYRVSEDGAGRAQLVLSGRDILKRAAAVSVVTLRRDRPVAEIQTTVANETATRTLREPDFRDFAALSALESSGGDARLLLPAERVTLLDSAGDWAGAKNASVPWSEPLSRWSSIAGRYHARAAAAPELPCLAVLYPALRTAVVKIWSPAGYFNAIEVTARGPGYAGEPGAGPYYLVSCVKDNLELAPQAQTQFGTAFVVLRDIPENASLSELFSRASRLLEETAGPPAN